MKDSLYYWKGPFLSQGQATEELQGLTCKMPPHPGGLAWATIEGKAGGGANSHVNNPGRPCAKQANTKITIT